jgi:multidrug efflux pump subunit AcrA (membrane-fusion protein)
VEVEIPRTATDRENALERGQLEFQKKSIELPRNLKKKELEYAKLKFAFEKKERDYAELIADALYMNLTAPITGTVYHGHSRRGFLKKGATTTNRLIEIGDVVAVGLPVITLVDIKNLQLRCDFDQRQRSNLKVGTKVLVSFDDRPEERIEGAIAEIGQFPLDDGKFDGLIQLPQFPTGIVPGMSCKVKVVTYKNDQAIMVPKASVYSDDGGLSQYVYVLAGERPQKRPVVALRELGDQVEVTQGLAAGDKILKKKPE